VDEKPAPRPILWIASSKRDLKTFPEQVQHEVGHALWVAQIGQKHPNAKVLKGFGDASVLEIVDDWEGSTFRAVYTVRFGEIVYVLHAFRKKSRRGAQTPKRDIDLIKKRLQDARCDYEARKEAKGNG
jgi:phage-related protein